MLLPPNSKYFVMYRKVKKKNQGGEVKKKKGNVFVRAFLILSFSIFFSG